MSDRWAIRASGLGKQYYLGEGEQYLALRDVIAGIPARLLGRADRTEPETLWALRDIDLEIPSGEVLGIVGRNGAGKSTLLKVLSRVTHPTVGSVEIAGRVGSLLEVGTGFHPELTGRENVYLNGAILGMSRAEISLRFDDIVDFSGVSAFLDTPVKRYSTGMYMRLAFAVAAHLEPEILLVDEVLAVGDAEFQRQCLGRMRELAQGQGRTVILVSHNLDAVSQLSRNSIWLDHGHLNEVGTTTEIVDAYLASRRIGSAVGEWVDLDSRPRASGDDVRILEARVCTPHSTPRLESNEAVRIELRVDAKQPTTLGAAIARISTVGGTRVLDAGVNADTSSGDGGLDLPAGVSTIGIDLAELPLAPGAFSVDLLVTRVAGSGRKRGVFDLVEGALDLEVHATDRSPAIDALVPVRTVVEVMEPDRGG